MKHLRFFGSVCAVVAICVLTAAPARAQKPVSHETIAVTSAAASGLATTTLRPSGVQVTSCLFTIEGGAIRVWVDTSTPTTSAGHWFSPGLAVLMTSYEVASQFKAIAVGTAATLQVSCIRGPQAVDQAPLVVVSDSGVIGQPCNPLLKASGVCR